MGTTNAASTKDAPSSHAHELLDRCEQILQRHRAENPDLYYIVELNKQKRFTSDSTKVDSSQKTKSNPTTAIKNEPLFMGPLRGAALRARIQQSHHDIRQRVLAADADIIPRTQAHHRKSSFLSVEEERDFRSDVVASQIRAWRSLLPNLIKKLSRIPDPRRTKSIKHQLVVLMIFGLLAFIFRLTSRREMTRELTGPLIHENLKKLFPEIDTIPHADTLARLLEKMDPKNIEEIHIKFIKELIKKKKFRKLLIHDCLPVTMDGTQKLCRDGLMQDPSWCERKVGRNHSYDKQQYIYVIEANITLQNGLTIPLITEYLHRENNELMQVNGKQDSETTAFERMAKRLKKYFPRQKMIFFSDAMYATQSMMEMLNKNHWEFIIRLPKNKLKNLAKCLSKNKPFRQSIPGQPAYRKRKQAFYWENNIIHGDEWPLTVHLAGCFEQYEKVDHKTGEIMPCFSEHVWISSIPVNINKVHELFNLGARKKELMEDSINTEKNRGYQYKHAFSYHMNAMKGFHLLMRLGHAINAISEFTKELKRYIKELGCSATLKMIKDTLFSPWLSLDWYEEQSLKFPQLRLQLE